MFPEFEVHVLNEDGIAEAQNVAEIFDATLHQLETSAIEGRYAAIVRTKLEEACFFAKKGVAVQERYQIA